MSTDPWDGSVDVALDQLHAIDGAIGGVLPDATADGAQLLAEDARRRVAVDSGKTRDSIEVRQTDDDGSDGDAAAQVRVPWFVGRFLEYGTVKMAARPFLRPAADAQRRAISKLIRNRVDEALSDVASGRSVSIRSRRR